MKSFIKLCIISLIVLSSCKKNVSLPYTFTGKVTDLNGNPISDVTLNLSAYYSSTIFASGGYTRVAEAKTDNEGNFKSSFNYANGANSLMIQGFVNNYFPYFNETVFTTDIQNNALLKNLTLNKLSTIKINFKNVSPASSTDEFSVFQSNEIFGPVFYTFIERQFTGGTYNELENKYVGSNVQGYVITKTKGDAYTVINWTSKKNGIIRYVQDSIFIAGNSQGNYNINY